MTTNTYPVHFITCFLLWSYLLHVIPQTRHETKLDIYVVINIYKHIPAKLLVPCFYGTNIPYISNIQMYYCGRQLLNFKQISFWKINNGCITSRYWNEIQTKYHTVRTIPKSNRKFVDIDKTDTHNTQTRDRSLWYIRYSIMKHY